ncbi:MAG: adenosine kinase [Enterobacterales bacterium]|nr:adenosine kinase [Enterobacterales bacterium]
MTQYNVYGLGNALVDIEIELDESELARMGVEKSVMTLIDEQRHHDLLMHIQGQAHNRACGGSAANTTIAVAQLGGKGFYSCRIGNDESGDFYLMDLHREGVASNLDEVPRELGVTGKCLVMITPDADRSMNTYLGITTDLVPQCLDLDALSHSDYLYIEGYLASSETAVSTAVTALQHARKNNVKTAVSLSDPSMIQFCRPGLDTMLAEKIDLLFSNEVEALDYTQTNSLEEATEALKSIAERFVITLGPKGAIAYDGNELITIEPHRVKAIDTNGAGDLFAGTFLYALTHGMTFEMAGELASFASAQLVTCFGPRLTLDYQEKVKAYGNSLA